MAIDDFQIACSTNESRGGHKRVWFMAGCDIASIATGTASTHSCGTITNTTGSTFQRYDFDVNTAALDVPASNENFSNSYVATLTMNISPIDEAGLFLLSELSKLNNVVCVVEEFNSAGTNNRAKLLGYDDIMENAHGGRVSVSSNTEGEISGVNTYTVTYVAPMAELPRFIVGDITADIDGTVSLGA